MSVLPIHQPAIRPPTGDLTGEALERYARNPKVSEAEKVEEASRQFEAVLVRQILAAARKTVIPSDLQQESAETGIYQDMINAQLAEAICHSGSLGLARSLQVQISHRPSAVIEGQTPSAEPPGKAPARNLPIFPVRHD